MCSDVSVDRQTTRNGDTEIIARPCEAGVTGLVGK
jgi:hypothetical protein